MTFSKSFPRTTDKSTYPIWEEIRLNNVEEQEQEIKARKEHIRIMQECIDDAQHIMQEKKLKPYQTDMIHIAMTLFDKRASHEVYFKEEFAKQKFDQKFL